MVGPLEVLDVHVLGLHRKNVHVVTWLGGRLLLLEIEALSDHRLVHLSQVGCGVLDGGGRVERLGLEVECDRL